MQGWGLFAGEDIKRGDYIGEYKGEVIGSKESDRRGAVYHHRGLEYLFKLNKDQEIDSSRAGNKMRSINVAPRKALCNGVQRIGLFACKNIEAGEELFFDYRYPIEVTKKFWERGDAVAQDHDRIAVPHQQTPKGKAKRTTAALPRDHGSAGSARTVSPSRLAGLDDWWVGRQGQAISNAGASRTLSLFPRRKRKRTEEEGTDELGRSTILLEKSEDAAEEEEEEWGTTPFSSGRLAREIAESGDDEDYEAADTSEDDELESKNDDDGHESSYDERAVKLGAVGLRGGSVWNGRKGDAGPGQGRARRKKEALSSATVSPMRVVQMRRAVSRRRQKKRAGRSARGSWLGTGGRPPREHKDLVDGTSVNHVTDEGRAGK